MPLAEMDRIRIADYANQGDREDEPAFVGRKDLFDLVARNMRAAMRGRSKGRTICLAGPPGIGKTAFLSEMNVHSAKPGRIGETGMVCLYVDEAHGLQPSEGLPKGETRNIAVGDLHEGAPPQVAPSGRRVFGLFAGHAHTPEILEKSLSWRLADGNLRYMRNLSGEDSLRYVKRTLDHLGVSGADPGRHALARWVAGECGGFPHHLRSAMCSVADGLLRADGLALPDLDGRFVMDRLRARRVAYYQRRTQGAIGPVKTELGALLREWSIEGGPSDKEAGEAALHRFMNGLAPDARTLMDSRGVGNSAKLIDEMMRKGILMTDPEGGGCRCPIDSLISWMESGGHVFREPFPSLAGRPC